MHNIAKGIQILQKVKNVSSQMDQRELNEFINGGYSEKALEVEKEWNEYITEMINHGFLFKDSIAIFDHSCSDERYRDIITILSFLIIKSSGEHKNWIYESSDLSTSVYFGDHDSNVIYNFVNALERNIGHWYYDDLQKVQEYFDKYGIHPVKIFYLTDKNYEVIKESIGDGNKVFPSTFIYWNVGFGNLSLHRIIESNIILLNGVDIEATSDNRLSII